MEGHVMEQLLGNHLRWQEVIPGRQEMLRNLVR